MCSTLERERPIPSVPSTLREIEVQCSGNAEEEPLRLGFPFHFSGNIGDPQEPKQGRCLRGCEESACWLPWFAGAMPGSPLRGWTEGGRRQTLDQHGPSSSLDPYTRLLASVADIVTTARQSLSTSVLGCVALAVAVGALLWSVIAVLLVTSFFWGPVMFFLLSTHVVSSLSKRLLLSMRQGMRRAQDKTLKSLHRLSRTLEQWCVSINSSDDRVREYEVAIKNRPFMRNLFDSLPGVDTQGALQRIERLEQWALAVSPPLHPQRTSADASDCFRRVRAPPPLGDAAPSPSRRRREPGAGGWGSEGDDASLSSSGSQKAVWPEKLLGERHGIGQEDERGEACVSPMEELIASGRLHRVASDDYFASCQSDSST